MSAYVHAEIHPPGYGPGANPKCGSEDPLGVGLETPPECGPGDPQVWAGDPQCEPGDPLGVGMGTHQLAGKERETGRPRPSGLLARSLNYPPGCGPGDPPRPDPLTSLLGVCLETCKACWDTPP